jgi:dipeptidyl aminopeptidase/acylaminoacyl peptidase
LASDVLSRPAPPPDLVLSYGPEPEHVADVRLPPLPAGPPSTGAPSAGALPGGPLPGGAPPAVGRPGPLVVFLHGGFWRVTFDRTHTGPLATALAEAGFAVCVPEFRRTGQRGGGWPGTFDDVAAAVDVLPTLVRDAAGAGRVSDQPALLAGHSAGGHLALWAAARHRLPPDSGWRAPGPRFRGVVALAAVSDMSACYALDLGRGAAGALLGGGPGQHPERYRSADPMLLLPLDRPVRLVHGSADDQVPVGMSHDYVGRAHAAGDDVALDELSGAGHFEVIDPLSSWWSRVQAAFAELAPLPSGSA